MVPENQVKGKGSVRLRGVGCLRLGFRALLGGPGDLVRQL